MEVPFMSTASDAHYQRVVGSGAITSCFTCELLVIIEAFDLYDTLPILEQASISVTQGQLSRLQELDKVCFLQWLPTHIDLAGNESANRLAKEARNLNNDKFVNVTLLDANFKLREKSIPEKYQICNISRDLLIPKFIARLRTGHYRGMKFDRDGRRSDRNCDNCSDTELTPAQISHCPAILADLQKNRGHIFVNKSLC
ncbi:RNase H domain-containing protein [Trichonephila clavipes]|nr:RNase H domain-containing protein [Trichonephila clavipes]